MRARIRRGKVALAGIHEGAQAVGLGRFSVPSNGKAGWRIVTSVVVSSAGEDVLDSPRGWHRIPDGCAR